MILDVNSGGDMLTIKNHIGMFLLILLMSYVISVLLHFTDKNDYNIDKYTNTAVSIFVVVELFYWIISYFFLW